MHIVLKTEPVTSSAPIVLPVWFVQAHLATMQIQRVARHCRIRPELARTIVDLALSKTGPLA